VENASLLPWLTGVGLLHSFTVYRRRGAFKKWAVMMSSISFVLVLLGTFITRSGVIQSVHGFGEDPLSLWWFLGMMVISLAVPAIGLIVRGDLFKGNDEFASLMSKDGSYYFTNLFMVFSAVLVAGLTLSPAFGGPTFSGPSFDLLARPIGIFFVLMMTVCPILSWGATGWDDFWKRAKWPVIGGSVLSVGLLAVWALTLLPNYTVSGKGLGALAGIQAPLDHIESVIGLIVAGFAIALPIYLFIDGSRKRAAARGENPLVAFGNIVFKSRTQRLPDAPRHRHRAHRTHRLLHVREGLAVHDPEPGRRLTADRRLLADLQGHPGPDALQRRRPVARHGRPEEGWRARRDSAADVHGAREPLLEPGFEAQRGRPLRGTA
jgi:cytochrome c-type biogenesis protein CcmF